MNKITNPQSCYFNQNCKVIRKLEDNKLEVLLQDDEILIEVSCEDIDLKRTLCKPRSRKELYCHIKDPMVTRTDVKATIEHLLSTGGIVTGDIEPVVNLIMDMNKDPEVIVEELRTMRDSGVFQFTLPNVVYDKKPHFKHKQNKFNRN